MPFPPPNEKQARLIWAALTGLAAALIVALVVAFVWGIGRVLEILAPVLWPLAVAGVLAYLLDPVVDFLERRRVPRTRAIIVVFALAILIVVGLLGSIVPQIVVETQELSVKIPGYTTNLQAKVEKVISHPPDWLKKFIPQQTGTNTSFAQPEIANARTETTVSTNHPDVRAVFDESSLRSATDWLSDALPTAGAWLRNVVSFVASWFSIMAGLALIPIYAFYFLLEKRGIAAQWQDYLPVKNSALKDEVVFVVGSTNEYLIAFFRGQVLVAICDGILYTIGFLIAGVPYAVLIGAMAVFLTMIPFLGAITTCVVALVITFVQYGDWQHPALVLAVFAVVQSLEGLVISPKIMGDRVGLHPLTIIIAVMAGTTLLGGILGGILAIPLTAVLRTVMFRYVWRKPEKTPAA